MDDLPISAWFHGSPVRLTTLRAGSTVTPDRDVARVYSHKPRLVSQEWDDQGTRSLKHSGQQPGFLYTIAELLQPGDLYPHPASTLAPGQEWLTTRELQLVLLGPTAVRPEDQLSDTDTAVLEQRIRASDESGGSKA